MQIDTSYRKDRKYTPGHGYGRKLGSGWIATRSGAVESVIIHATHGRVGSLSTSEAAFLRDSPNVSAHYLIGRDGLLFVILPETYLAWHSGDCEPNAFENNTSIGIELHAATTEEITPAQKSTLATLLREINTRHRVPSTLMRSHRSVAVPAGRKSDPATWNDADLNAWIATTLNSPAPSPLFRGPVLTFVPDVQRLRQSIVAGGYTALKVVTAWGGIQWTDTTRAQAAALCEQLIVRTHEGDPSSGKPYPHAERILDEISPWEHFRPGLWIEIGNEPNHPGYGVDPAGYAWQLQNTITQCQKAFPRAKIIGPALMVKEGDAAAWLSNRDFAAALRSCDAIGVHAYAFHQFDDAGFLKEIERLYKPFADLPWVLTEFGINDPGTSDATKGKRYAELKLPAPYIGALHYHIDLAAAPGSDAERYALDLTGDVAYGEAVK